MTFDLSPEEKCKQRWAPWFKRGKWSIIDFTQPKSAQLQILDLLKSIEPYMKNGQAAKAIINRELLTFLVNLRFPFDGIATRGAFMFCFDYKFIRNSSKGLAIAKDAYDKYWRWQLPWFYILLYTNDKGKLWMHQIQDPSKLNLFAHTELDHYDVTKHSWEPINPEVPFAIEIPTSVEQAIAQILKINEFEKAYVQYDATPSLVHYAKAKEILVKGCSGLHIRGMRRGQFKRKRHKTVT